MAELAGHLSRVRMTGTATTMTGEATSSLGGNVFRITNAARRIIDPDTALVVLDDGVPMSAADIVAVDLLFGKVTLDGDYEPDGDITITGKFLPTAVIANATGWEWNSSRVEENSTRLGDTHRRRLLGIHDVEGTITGLHLVEDTVGADTIEDKFDSGAAFVLEIDPDGAGAYLHRALVKFPSLTSSAAREGLVEATINWSLAKRESVDGWPLALSRG